MPGLSKHYWIVPLLCLLMINPGQNVHGAEPDEISLESLRSHVYFLASDYLGGRVIGSTGYRIAAEYAASQLAAAGLQPFSFGKTGPNQYFQVVPIPDPGDAVQPASGALSGECYNVIAYLPGNNPDLAREYVVVSAHLDHIPPINGEICNGADDNASGCAAVLEIASRLAEKQLDRSVIFVLFTGEDYAADARLGSRYFVEHWPSEQGHIFVNVNVDMIGREDTTWPEPGGITVMDCESVCPRLREVCTRSNDKRLKLPIHFHVSSGGASDDLSFADTGIPSLGTFTGAHPDLHRASDEVDKLSFPRIQQVTGLTLGFVHELASGETELCR